VESRLRIAVEEKIIRCFSVQHTGTHFMIKLLQGNGFCVNASHFGNSKVSGFTVCPIRSPRSAYRTWVSRGFKSEDFATQWERFNNAFLTNDQLFVLPIDTFDRAIYLEELGGLLGKVLSTDWKKVSSLPNGEVPYKDLTHICKLPLVEKFYA